MKLKITLLLLIGLIAFACSPEQEQIEANNTAADYLGTLNGATQGTSSASELDVDLLGGQNILTGIVNVTVVNGNIQVTYSADGDWAITETHLYIGDFNNIPTNGAGNPMIGSFPYSGTHDLNTYDVIYVGENINEGDCTYIAAHAVVVNTASGQEETAWGAGIQIGGFQGGNSWATAFEYCY